MYTVYILRTNLDTLYIGQTSDLDKRLKDHREKRGIGSKYVRAFESFELVYTEQFETRSEAMKREWELKQWPKQKKEALIKDSVSPVRVQ
jgi:putative endonuclease